MTTQSMLGDFCAQFGCPVPAHTVKIGRRWFYDPQGLGAFAQEKKWDAFSAGLYLGEERGTLRATSALLDLLKKAPRVTVDEKAAWLIVCGKDVLMQGALIPGEHPVGTLVIIDDSQEHVLGFGKVVSAHIPKAKHRVYVKTLLDRGEYLRRERS